MKFRKIIITLCLVVLLFIGINVNVNADMGPKPKIIIDIKGIEGEYVACFASQESWGPNYDYEDWCEANKDSTSSGYLIEYNPIMEYKDDEGFKWITKYDICKGDSTIKFTYYRPEIFKIVIYKDNKLYKVTEKIDCYAFNTELEIDFSNNEIKIKNTYPYFIEVLQLIFRISITLFIEIGLFFIFKLYTKRNIIVVGITNIVTQLALNLVINITTYFDGSLLAIFYLILMEFLILIIEPIIYIIFTKEKKKWLVLIYGLLANILSFFIGAIILTFIG